MARTKTDTRTRLLDATLDAVRAKGYAATTIDDICTAGGVTKGGFFHYFASKDELAIAAAEHWSATTGALFAAALYHTLAEPFDRLLGYIDLRIGLLRGDPARFSCFAGTMVQETFATHPAIRKACGKCIVDHAATLEDDIAAAMRTRGISGDWTAASLALHIQATIQGALVVAKAKNGPDAALQCLKHLRRYLELLFKSSPA